MANSILHRQEATAIAVPSLRRRHLLEFGAAVVAAAAILALVLGGTGGSNEVTPAVNADALRWEALVESRYPAATPAAIAEAARWEALAEAYAGYTILPQGKVAEGARWSAISDSYLKGQVAEASRLTGLAEHYLGLPPALQAAADRYQGLANTMK